jgi:CotH kinase protein/Secretion system C-terminal sorting domain
MIRYLFSILSLLPLCVASAQTLTSNLPLIIINTTETDDIYDEPKVPADMGIIDNGPGQMNSSTDDYNDYDGRISIEIRGASSQMFPKKNYSFETQDTLGENNNVSLLGLPEENDWVLHGPYSDKSLLRNVLAYHIGEVTGKYTPRTRLCEVIINGDYRGVYMLTEAIKRDENRVDIAKLTPEDISGDEITGGYILQIDRDNGTGWTSSFPDNKYYVFEDPKHDELVQAQKSYIQNYIYSFESAMNSANYQTAYLEYVDLDTWVDYFLATEIGKHIDAFKLSFFMYKKRDSDGGKLHFGPLWDFNLAYGNFDFVCSPDPEGWSYLFRGTCDMWHPFWIKKLTEIPHVSNLTNCRWQELRAGGLHTDSLLAFIDQNVALLAEPHIRNFDRWPVIGQYVWPNGFVGNSYEEEIDFLKTWLSERLDWMDENMIGQCGLSDVQADLNTSETNWRVYPNPAQSYITVEFSGTDFEQTQLYLYDMLGRQVGVHNITATTETIYIGDKTSGFYLFKLQGADGVILNDWIVLKGE